MENIKQLIIELSNLELIELQLFINDVIQDRENEMDLNSYENDVAEG